MVDLNLYIFIQIYWYFIRQFILIYNYFYRIYIKLYKYYKYNTSNNIIIVKNSQLSYKNLIKFNDLDYIIYSQNNNTNDDKILTQLFTNINDIINIKNPLIECNFTFILVLIKTNNSSYDITKFLKNIYEYYYVNNAILFDPNFMNWISIHYIKYPLDNYTITIMDNCCKEVSLTSLQYIKLNKTDYEILNN
jgi:hypothetical protein